MGILALICFILSFVVLGYFIFKMIKIVKNNEIGQEKYKIVGKERTLLLCLVGACSFLLLISAITFVVYKKYPMNFLEFFVLIIGSIVMGATISFAVGSFILYYYRTDLDEKQRNICRSTAM